MLLDDPAVAEATYTATIRPITLSTSAGPASLSAVRVKRSCYLKMMVTLR
jgi:hypothetical protein